MFSVGPRPEKSRAWRVRRAALGSAGPLPLRLVHHRHHPADAESVLQDSKLRRPKSFLERHSYQAAVAQRRKNTLRFRFVRHRDGKREPFESRRPFAAAVGSHDQRLADAQSRVHDFFCEAFWKSRFLFRRVFEPRKHYDLGAERLAIKLNRFFAAAAKKWIRLD